MRYDYNIEENINTLVLESAFDQLEQLKNKAQNEIYNITHETSFDNVFKKVFKAIRGYNSSLFRQYMRILDNFVEKTTQALQSKDIISLDIIVPEHKEILIDIIKWIVEIYSTILENRKTFKQGNASLLIGTMYELLDEMNDILYNIISKQDYAEIKKENIEKELHIKQTKGFIDINEFIIESFS